MKRQIATDMERKIVENMQAWLERELNIARLVLEPHEIAMILVILATGTTSTAAATISNMVNDTTTPDAMFDEVCAQVASGAKAAKPTAMTRVAALRAEASATS